MKLVKIEKISKMIEDIDQLPSPFPEINLLAKAIKNYAKADMKAFWFCPVLFDFQILVPNILFSLVRSLPLTNYFLAIVIK